MAGVEGMRAPGLNSARPGDSAATVTIVTIVTIVTTVTTITRQHWHHHQHRHRKARDAVRWGCPCPAAAVQKGHPHPGCLSPAWGFVPTPMPPACVNVPASVVGAGDAVTPPNTTSQDVLPSLMPPPCLDATTLP